MQLVKFLLVEDNIDHADLVIETMRTSRFANEFDHVVTGEEALDYCRQSGKFTDKTRPDVVLLDLQLPGIEGLDVLKEIKSDPKLKTIAVVILTSSDAERDRAKAYEYCANSYVTKPIDFEQLNEIVNQMCLYWGIVNRPVNV